MFKINTNIISGKGELRNLKKYVKKSAIKYPAILCDANLYNNSKYVRDIIKRNIISSNYLFLFDYKFEPSYQYLDSLIKKVRTKKIYKKIDSWIAIGGGSTIDTAKGLAILCRNKKPSIAYKGFPKKLNTPLPIIAIPSTTGTGSEVVYNASFIDEKNKVKMGINYVFNYPIIAILDPLVVSTAPKNIFAMSSCDTLVHILESFVSIKNTPQSRVFSKHAYSLIIKNFPIIMKGRGKIDNWLNMQWASVFAMFALSNTSSGPAGALSYHLGTNYGINHGFAGGMIIGKITRYNHKSNYFEYSDLLSSNTKNYSMMSLKQKSLTVVRQVEDFLRIAKVPSLKSFGINHKRTDEFINFSKRTKTAFNFNPVKVNINSLIKYFLR